MIMKLRIFYFFMLWRFFYEEKQKIIQHNGKIQVCIIKEKEIYKTVEEFLTAMFIEWKISFSGESWIHHQLGSFPLNNKQLYYNWCIYQASLINLSSLNLQKVLQPPYNATTIYKF